MEKPRISNKEDIRTSPIRSVLEVGGMLKKYAEGKTTDWETIRTETEKAVAEDIVRKGRKFDAQGLD